jgi:hypothetical protein
MLQQILFLGNNTRTIYFLDDFAAGVGLQRPTPLAITICSTEPCNCGTIDLIHQNPIGSKTGMASCKYLNRYIFTIGGTNYDTITLFDTQTNAFAIVSELQQSR